MTRHEFLAWVDSLDDEALCNHADEVAIIPTNLATPSFAERVRVELRTLSQGLPE